MEMKFRQFSLAFINQKIKCLFLLQFMYISNLKNI